MARFAIVASDSDASTKKQLAVTIADSGKQLRLAPFENLSSQVWIPTFCLGLTTAGVAFLNTAGSTVALRGIEGGKDVEATQFHGDNTDDQVIWSFAPGSSRFTLRIIWATNTIFALNAATSASEGNSVCIWDSKGGKPSNEDWRLVPVDG
jgi:hypothetical protein